MVGSTDVGSSEVGGLLELGCEGMWSQLGRSEAVIGESAIEAVKRFNFTKCFMGANGVDINKGFSTPDVDEAAIKGAVIKQSYVSSTFLRYVMPKTLNNKTEVQRQRSPDR